LVRDKHVTGQLEIEVSDRVRIVEQIVCLIDDDAVGNSVALSDLANPGQKRLDVAPLFDVAYL
jgi:hypothetical protein